MWKATKTIAFEQHMDSMTVGLAAAGRGSPELYGDIPSTPEAVTKLVHRLDEGVHGCASVTRPVRVAMGFTDS